MVGSKKNGVTTKSWNTLWHQDEIRDNERQTGLEKLGWKFIRYRDYIPSIEKLSEDIKCRI